jgi:uncharacterized damage-inducible protein DinB
LLTPTQCPGILTRTKTDNPLLRRTDVQGSGAVESIHAEAAGTRKALERVPFEKAEWAPHEKSMTLGRLAGHLAEAPSWEVSILTTEEFDIAPPDGGGYAPPVFESLDDILGAFDRGVSEIEAALPDLTDKALAEHWSLKSGGEEIMGGPRTRFFTNMVTSHIIHHRGQLTVYLRLYDVPVPGMYGPSADEH